jgi:hypothetical protein
MIKKVMLVIMILAQPNQRPIFATRKYKIKVNLRRDSALEKTTSQVGSHL